MCYGAMDGPTRGYNEKNGPKRMCIVLFGPFISFFFTIRVFLHILIIWLVFIAIINTINPQKHYD